MEAPNEFPTVFLAASSNSMLKRGPMKGRLGFVCE